MKKTLALLLLLAGLSGEVRAETLFWNGSKGHMTWNTEDTNWSQGGASVKYSDGNDVVFAHYGSGTVTLSGTFVPASVMVTAREDYIFDGAGKLTGNMQLDKYGTGTLTINTANDYTGDTNIYEGTLVIGNDHALGTGTIKLFGNTTLNLGQKNLSNKVSLEQGETAFIGNGSISSDLIVGTGKTLTLIGDLDGRGEITLGQSTTLDLGNNTLYNNVSLSGETASIGNGSIHGDVVVGDGKTLTFIGNLKVYGQINLGNNTTLHLGKNSLFNDVSLSGSASIGNGHIHGDVFVGTGKTLTLIDNLDGGGEIKLSDNATLNLGQNILNINVSLAGETAFIGNGSIRCVLSVGDGKTLTLIGDLEGYQINLGNNTTLDLGKNTLNMYHVCLSGSTTIGNGTIEGDLQVAEGKKLSLQQQITVTGTVNLAANAALDLGGNAFHQGGDVGNRVAFAGDATIGNGTITGDLDVAANQNLTLLHDTTVTGTVNLAANAALDLGNNTLYNDVSLSGSASIGNGGIRRTLNIGNGKTLTLIGDLDGSGRIMLDDNATLNLGKNALYNDVILLGSVSIGNGRIFKDLFLENGKTMTLIGDLDGSGKIMLDDNTTLNLANNTLYNDVSLSGSASIGNGSIRSLLLVGKGKTLTLIGDLVGNGQIKLGDNTTLNLGNNTLYNDVSLSGSASIGNGDIHSVLNIGNGKTLTLIGDLAGNGQIKLDDNAMLNLGGHYLYNDVSLSGSASIGNGSIRSVLNIGNGKTLTLIGDLAGIGQIKLGDNATLDLGKNALFNDVSLSGSASIGNGRIFDDLYLGNGKTLTLIGDLDSSGKITLSDNATLDLGGHYLSVMDVTQDGKTAFIGNGSIRSVLNIGNGKTLTLIGDLAGNDQIKLDDNAMLNLGGHNLSVNVSLTGDATIGNGTITGDLTVAAGTQINLLASTTITGGVTLSDNASLDLGNNTVTGAAFTFDGSGHTIGNGVIEGDLTVAGGKSLALLENTTVTGAISLGQNSTLNLGGNTITQDVGVSGSATIGNGSVNGDITFAAGNQQISLCGNLGGTGDISIGVVNSTSTVPHPTFTSTLNLGGHTLTKGLKLVGDTTVSNGKLVLAHDMTRSLFDIPARTVTIGAETTVDLNSHTFSHDLTIADDTAIGNGTIGGNVTVKDGKSVRFFGETKIDSNNEGLVSYHGNIEIGGTTIQALHRPLESQIGAPVYPGLMKELTVSENEILGTGRASSLADGLEIQSEADLMIQGMTITADNKISVGQNTITLNDVTIKLSQASYNIVDGVYYFNLSDLFHCSVDMTDVTFDASALELPKGFNPETNGISFNLGDAKLTSETAERDIYLLMGGYGSRTMRLDDQGNPVFTALVPTPEPTTGTLSLLALAALAARRRRK